MRITLLPARLVMGVLANSEEAYTEALSRTQNVFGPLLEKTDTVPFERFSRYYEDEMGPGLVRAYWAFSEPVTRGVLVEAKLATNSIEKTLGIRGMRTVNLDPGLLSPESLVMATTKPYSHRIYLSKGIYGELAFMFQKGGRIIFLPWTYPDYRDPEATGFFTSIRKEVLLS